MNKKFFQLIPKSHQAVGGDSCGTKTQPVVLVVRLSTERDCGAALQRGLLSGFLLSALDFQERTVCHT